MLGFNGVSTAPVSFLGEFILYPGFYVCFTPQSQPLREKWTAIPY